MQVNCDMLLIAATVMHYKTELRDKKMNHKQLKRDLTCVAKKEVCYNSGTQLQPQAASSPDELLELNEANPQYAVLPSDKREATEVATLVLTTPQPLAGLPSLQTIGPQILANCGISLSIIAWLSCFSLVFAISKSSPVSLLIRSTPALQTGWKAPPSAPVIGSTS